MGDMLESERCNTDGEITLSWKLLYILLLLQDSYHKNRSSEEWGQILGQILDSERCWNRNPFLINPLVEALEHNRLSHPFVGLGRHIGFLQDIVGHFVTWIAVAIIYLNSGSCEFEGLDLSDLLGLCQIDDLDGVRPNKTRTGCHHGANGAVPASRGLPDPLML